MPQLHFYVSREVAARVQRLARSRGLSASRLVADLVQRSLDADWPESYAEAVLGGWRGSPLVRPEPLEIEERTRF